MNATNVKNTSPKPGAIILPRVKMDESTFYDTLGMTPRQVDIAFKIALHAPGDARSRMCKAGDRALDAQREFETQLTTWRRELVAAMFERYPAAAMRIMAGKPPRRRKA
jgi:hypothetical protein